MGKSNTSEVWNAQAEGKSELGLTEEWHSCRAPALHARDVSAISGLIPLGMAQLYFCSSML